MHIPDGYLSPQTYAPAYALMAALWAWGSARLQRTLRNRQVPLLALGAAFCFVIMMFNVPLPGGTSGHAVGAVLIAILLGPWAAMIAVSLALIVQALLFSDGGITAIGANCVNMAVVMPFVGWGVYRLIAGSASATSPRQWIGGAIGGYVGLNAAAVTTALMFGIQPLIAHDAEGHALYCPYGLEVAVPVMVVGHLLVGLVEAAVTGLVLVYLQRAAPALLPGTHAGTPAGSRLRRVAIGLGLLMLLTPLGLYLPARFAAGSAWGEWSASEMHKLVGYVPAQLAKWDGRVKAPLPDYSLPGKADAPLAAASLYYILSAIVGVLALLVVVFALRKLFTRKEPDDRPAPVDVPAHHA